MLQRTMCSTWLRRQRAANWTNEELYENKQPTCKEPPCETLCYMHTTPLNDTMCFGTVETFSALELNADADDPTKSPHSIPCLPAPCAKIRSPRGVVWSNICDIQTSNAIARFWNVSWRSSRTRSFGSFIDTHLDRGHASFSGKSKTFVRCQRKQWFL